MNIYTESLSDEINLEMISIPGGTFLMGAPKDELESDDSERPQHQVTLKPFYMSRHTITQAQWRVVTSYPQVKRELNPDPSYFKGDKRPVESITWSDATEFCQRLATKTRKKYKLPSEAQWEYACRAGTTTPFYFGKTITAELANYRGASTYDDSLGEEYKKQIKEYRRQTTNVDSFPANAWGLHDMHGNVMEYCEDNYHCSYEGAPDDGTAWIDSDRTNMDRVMRSGAWNCPQRMSRSAFRTWTKSDSRLTFYDKGFRIVCVVPSDNMK